jgi:dTMP kinase
VIERGKFITLEGGEGVGKSTNLAFLQARLLDAGIDVRVTREPGGTPLGEAIRSLLLNEGPTAPSALAEVLLVFAARAQHIQEVIEPALAAGRWVLCDRFTDATYAYQGFARGLSQSAIATLESLVQGSLQPDLTVLLDLPPSIGLKRASQRAELDRFEVEDEAFFNRVREGYLTRSLENPERWLVINAGQDLEGVQRALAQGFSSWMASHGS